MNVRVVTSRLPHFVQDLRALRVIRGTAAGQDELHRQNFANQMVGLDHPTGSLKRSKRDI